MRTETVLLDSSVLIASSVREHVHHAPAIEWLSKSNGRFATCPVTQGALVRYVLRENPRGWIFAKNLLGAVTGRSNHVFWPDALSYVEIDWQKLQGHGQATDAYLVALAAHHGGKLLTLDKALAAVFPEVLLIER